MIELDIPVPDSDEEIAERVFQIWRHSKGKTIPQIIQLTLKFKNEALERQKSEIGMEETV